MRAIKPMHLGFLSRCFEYERKFYLSVAVLTGFRFDGSVRLMSEMGLWLLAGKELGDDAVLDDGLPKSRAEFLVRGKAFCPGGRPQPTLPVKVRVAGVEKTLYVVGDRVWRHAVPTEPLPFTTMDLTWSRAYGGPGYARNPQGRGFAPVQGEDGKPIHPLPNVEMPGSMITSPGERREPAGFLPFGLDWPQRREKMGTYDEKWLREDYPGYPRDIDWRAFNVSSPDQQQDSFYAGDEEILCTNLHPEKPDVRGRLPAIQTRCFLAFKGASDPDALTECAMRATTLWLFPHLETGILIFHGAAQVGEEDAHDVADIVLAAENVGQPRPIEHYKSIRASVTAAEVESVLAIVEGSGLVPEGCEGIGEIAAEVDALTPQGIAAEAQNRRAIREYGDAKAALEVQGIDPEILGPPPEPHEPGLPDLSKIPQMIAAGKAKAEAAKEMAEKQRKKIEDDARKFCEEHDLDFESVMRTEPGPPDFSAARTLEEIEATLRTARLMGQPIPELEAMVATPDYRARVYATESQVYDTYLRNAHLEEKASPAATEELTARRADLLERVRRGESVSRRNWTGVDVSGEDLSGANLAGGFFERANFSKCNLSAANLESAVLAGANFDDANLSGAKLDKANLGRASLRGASAQQAPSITDATLDKIDMTGAVIPGLNLEGLTVREAKLDRANLSRAQGKLCTFLSCSMTAVDLSSSDLRDATFLECEATGLIATAANLEKASLHECRATEAKLDHARASNFRLTGNTILVGADFTESVLDRSNFRGVDLTDARFVRANLTRADLSDAKLIRADLEGVVAREALFIRTDFTEARLVRGDLMSALLSKANLTRADLSGASLYGADLARVRSHGGTNLTGVDQTRARIHPVQPPKAEP